MPPGPLQPSTDDAFRSCQIRWQHQRTRQQTSTSSTAVGSNGEDDDDGKATLPEEEKTKTFNGSEGPKPLDEANKDELDPLAPKRVAENTEPNEAAEAAGAAPQD